MEGEKCWKCGEREVFMCTIGREGVPIGEMGQCQCCGELSRLKNAITVRYDENIFEELKQIRTNKDEISLDYGDI